MGVSVKVNETSVKAEDLLSEAEAVLMAAQGTPLVPQHSIHETNAAKQPLV